MIWKQLKQLVFAIAYDSGTDAEAIRRAVVNELDPGMKSRLIFFSEKELKPELKPVLEGVTYVTAKELKRTSRKKNEDFDAITSRPSDALFICGTVGKRFEKRLKELKTGVVIGLNSENAFAEINLFPKSSEPNEMVNFAKNMLLKISTNE